MPFDEVRRVAKDRDVTVNDVVLATFRGAFAGTTTALLAALVIVGVPAVDFADLMDRHTPARFRASPGYDRLVDLAAQVQQVVSPLSIAPRVPQERRFIYAGLADRMVHPPRQVHALWAHWDEPAIKWFRSSHIGFFLSRPLEEFLSDALRGSGLVAEASESIVGA